MSKPPWDDSSIPDAVDKYVHVVPEGFKVNSTFAKSTRAGDALHTIHGYIIRESDKAILIEVQQVNDTKLADAEVPNGNRNMWFPLSQVSTISRAKSDTTDFDYIRAKEWICKQKDLI